VTLILLKLQEVAVIHLSQQSTTPITMSFTKDDIPDLRGKVFIITGGNSGVGESNSLEEASYTWLRRAAAAVCSAAAAHTPAAACSAAHQQQLQLHLLTAWQVQNPSVCSRHGLQLN
jgi:hypothetical protein